MSIDIVVSSDAGAGGGAEQWLVAVAGGLTGAGYRVVVAHPDDGPALPMRLEAVRVAHRTRSFDRLQEDGARSNGLVGHHEHVALFRELAPAMVVFSDSTPTANIAAKEAAMGLGIPYISVVHLGAIHPDVDLSAIRPRLGTVFAQSVRVIGVSSHTVDQVRSFTGLPLPNATVIFNGVGEKYFAAAEGRVSSRQALDMADDVVAGISVGRVDSHKGYALMVEALSRITIDVPFEWWWVGGGPGLSRAQRAARLQPGPMRLLGERDDVADLLGAADMFALPTYRDSFCLAAVEAMAAGLPVAVSAVDGVPEVVADGALLLPNPNLDAAAATAHLQYTIERWMHDRDSRIDLGRRATARAREYFRSSRMESDYVDVVRSVIGRPQ